MTLIYQGKIRKGFAFVALLCACAFFAQGVSAQSNNASLSLSVTPTLFQMSAVPSQSWSSSVKVINNNAHPITVYATVVNFAAQGESGEGKFIPLLSNEDDDSHTLARWITISNEPIQIAPEQSYSIPFSVHVPEDAAPGGHFAAILVGTKPPQTEGAYKVSTSQIVTSLFFVRVAGDIHEEGAIREFRTTDSFVDAPSADFELRFENKGNVHLQPQGEIVITNMWGKERGIIPINKQTNFGNVLPNSIRKFEFSWKGERSFSDIGRYKAVVTLAYGDGQKQFETRTAYFFVIPVKAGLVVLAFLIVFALFARFVIKAYVRRMLMLAGVDPVMPEEKKKTHKSFVREGDVRIVKKASYKAPMESGVEDLRESLRSTEKLKALMEFAVAYKLFFIGLLGVLLTIATISWFVLEATKEHRDYEVTIDSIDANRTISSEEILHERGKEEVREPLESAVEKNESEQQYGLVLVNSSDTPGLAGVLQTNLESLGYEVAALKSDFEESKDRSVVVYDRGLETDALKLSKEVGNALLSASPETDAQSPSIIIYIGNDFKAE